jgi:hypothetical protein
MDDHMITKEVSPMKSQIGQAAAGTARLVRVGSKSLRVRDSATLESESQRSS